MVEKQSRLLIVDDDIEIRHLLVKLLQKYSYQVSSACNGNEMFVALKANDIDLIILDVMLPDEDGLSLCRKVRAHSNIPIIMLTAAGDETDRIIGLEIGADDYLAKPFNPRELVARIKAVMRRSPETKLMPAQTKQATLNNGKVAFAGWTLDMATRQLLSPDNVEITISSGEYDLLLAFIENPQQVLSRDHLLDCTQNRPAGPFDRSIDVQVSRLRQKIETNPKKPSLIKTIRGGGYLFTSAIQYAHSE